MVSTREIEIMNAKAGDELTTYLNEALNYFKHLEIEEMIINFNG